MQIVQGSIILGSLANRWIIILEDLRGAVILIYEQNLNMRCILVEIIFNKCAEPG